MNNGVPLIIERELDIQLTGEPVIKGDKGDPGQDGKDGKDGEDGYSPTVTVEDITGGHRVTITDETGAHTFDVMDGGDPTSIIDDTAGEGDTTKVWSADKTHGVTTNLSNEINQLDTAKQDAPETAGTAGQVLGLDNSLNPVWVDQSVGVIDYDDLTDKPQINGITLAGNKTGSELGLLSGEGVADAVDDWLDENITNPDSPPLDRSLTSSSAAAPADIVGEIKYAFDELSVNLEVDENGDATVSLGNIDLSAIEELVGGNA